MNDIILYYFPKAGEIPKEGDEYLSMRGEKWEKARLTTFPYGASDEGFIRRPMLQIPSQHPLHVVLCGSEFRKETTTIGHTVEKAKEGTMYCEWELGMGGYRVCPHNSAVVGVKEAYSGAVCPYCGKEIRIYQVGSKGERIYQ